MVGGGGRRALKIALLDDFGLSISDAIAALGEANRCTNADCFHHACDHILMALAEAIAEENEWSAEIKCTAKMLARRKGVLTTSAVTQSGPRTRQRTRALRGRSSAAFGTGDDLFFLGCCFNDCEGAVANREFA